MTPEEMYRRFEYHAPVGGKVMLHDLARCAVKDLAGHLDPLIPEGREKALAYTALEECLFWANAGIARQ